MQRLPDALEGAVDLHVHSAPDVDPRRFDDLDLAREAARAGMGAVLIKSHQNSTVERAWLVSKVVPGIRVFGGLTLNETVGGINPSAVELALRLGAKQIWMPTRSARNHRQLHGQEGGITILDETGALLPNVERVVQQIAAADCILSTGHLSPHEGTVLLRYAAKLGVRRMLVTHPEWAATCYSLSLQLELAGLGVFFERCFVSTTHRCGYTPLKTITQAIGAVGVMSSVLSSDLGQPDTPAPADGLRMYSAQIEAAGFDRTDLRRMMVTNPASLLGLRPEREP